ncbi:hypothetical protein PTSG_11983 [Salpingoeca rosetta]|uniref:JmjC domain-containing protein n=1 Tax=Salpingoeca rosetta (strain ATCC 50818 / BSB-021) TaxID=946362 RepID=F2U4N7_SALR5|nr:uncharacterized protein PTSG_11983 [Salpingoeca rosetta]EGD82603.1 hypothetical protein PTSG_11983 [Salpingoeca rosetta]|eukprot:XP_004995839.1 hypothetical protein PTSG_11983 [Salpingoeca rosetta]
MMSSLSGWQWRGLVVALVALVAANWLKPAPVIKPYEYEIINEIWTPQEQSELADMVRSYSEFFSVISDQTPATDNIGEAVPYDPEKGCTHPLMVPSRNGSHCILAPRLDIGRHYVLTGGNTGLKESYDKLVSRLLSFAQFFIGSNKDALAQNIPLIDKLFESPAYKKAVDKVCPGHPYLDPFQLGVIVQIPGQTVAMHYDAPWFWGADRMQYPIWLLVVMHASGLFHDIDLPQIQGVAYIHPWKVDNMTDADIASTFGGSFFFHHEGPERAPGRLAPRPGSAILLDGSKCIHGTDLYLPPGTTDAPMMQKDSKPSLVYSSKNTPTTPTRDTLWNVVADGKVVTTYKFSDLRIALVWRSKCFASKEEKRRYDNTPPLELSAILERLRADLVKRNRIDKDAVIAPIDFATLLLNEYVNYPLPRNTWMPYNYCALPRLFGEKQGGIITSLLKPFCT